MPYREGRWRTVHTRQANVEHVAFLFTCGRCGKHAYSSRKAARRAARVVERKQRPEDRGKGHLSVYPCPHDPEVFHYGHLAVDIVAGKVGREVYHR